MLIERKVPPRFAALRAKPPLFWVKTAVILAATSYLAWLSFTHAVANATWDRNPDTALYYVPDHPLALSRKADELFAQRQDPATLAKVEAMARQSLRGGALNPVAIRLLGYVAEALFLVTVWGRQKFMCIVLGHRGSPASKNGDLRLERSINRARLRRRVRST